MAEPGRRLGIDVGAARIGVAVSDPDGILASPLVTINRRDLDDDAAADRVAQLVAQTGAIGVVVGLPLHLSGARGAAAEQAESFAARLSQATGGINIELSDERYTTVTAHAALRSAGRKTKHHRDVVDQAAAVAILQGWLDARRQPGGGQMARLECEQTARYEGRPPGMRGDQDSE